jgi:hypothetical protein
MGETRDGKPLPAGQIRCVFVGGPLDGKTTDVDAFLSWQTPPESITASDMLKRPGVEHVYRRDGGVEVRPDVGRHLTMRYDGERPKPPAGEWFDRDRAVAEQYLRGWPQRG